jgi:hypothetical protein
MNMRKPILVLAALAATTAVAIPAGVASGTHAYGGNHVNANDLYVRDNQGRVIGRLYRNEHFTVERIAANGWAYGYGYGNVQKCGFVIEPHTWLVNATDGHADTPRC